MTYATLETVNAKYNVVMLDKSTASKSDLAANKVRNTDLALRHKEVAEYFGNSSFDAKTAKQISINHNLNW